MSNVIPFPLPKLRAADVVAAPLDLVWPKGMRLVEVVDRVYAGLAIYKMPDVIDGGRAALTDALRRRFRDHLAQLSRADYLTALMDDPRCADLAGDLPPPAA